MMGLLFNGKTFLKCLNRVQEEWRQTAASVVAGVEMGFLTPFIDREYPMETVQEAHAHVLSHEGGSRGKLVLTMT
jgi:NADPH2:quinone reductase